MNTPPSQPHHYGPPSPSQPGSPYGQPSSYGQPAPYGGPQPYQQAQPPQQYPHQQQYQQHPAQPYPGQPYLSPANASPEPPARVAPIVSYLGWAMVAISVFVIGAAFLTWAEVAGITIKGTSSDSDSGGKDGVVTIGLVVPVLVLGALRGLIRRPSKIHLSAGIVATLFGLLVTAIAIIDVLDILDTADKFKGVIEVSVGIGLWMTLGLGVVLTAVGVLGTIKRR